MTYAIIRLGGRQFKVQENDIIKLERQEKPVVEVLMYSDSEAKLLVGNPVIEGITVKLDKLEDKKDKKIRIGRFTSKSRHRRIEGHRQPISVFKVTSISEKGQKDKDEKVLPVVKEEVVVKEKKAKVTQPKNVEKVKSSKEVVADLPKKRGRPKKI